MSHTSTGSRTRLSAAAVVLGAAAAVTALTGAGPVPSIFQLAGANEDVRGNCDELEHANDPACAGFVTVQGTNEVSPTSTTLDDDQGVDDDGVDDNGLDDDDADDNDDADETLSSTSTTLDDSDDDSSDDEADDSSDDDSSENSGSGSSDSGSDDD